MTMTDNDNKQPKQKSLLPTDSQLSEKNYEMRGRPGQYLDGFSCGAKWMRGIVDRLIASGELIVAKTAMITKDGECTECEWDADHRYPFSVHCPGCGAKIIE